MSMEKELARIATALEKLANHDGELAADIEEDETAKVAKAKKVKAAKAKKAKDAKATAEAEDGDGDGDDLFGDDGDGDEEKVTRKQVEKALTKFVGPKGKRKKRAKEILGEFDAGSISTLDEDDFGKFIEALESDDD